MTEVLIFILVGIGLTVGALLFYRQSFSFYAQKPEDYEDGFPNFDLKTHLNGEMICDGAIYGPGGKVTSTFSADFTIRWDGDYGVMDETFRYSDGSVQERQWRISVQSDHTFTAESDDVPMGGRGMISGPTVQMLYDIRLPDDAGGHLLSTRDWMYLTPDGTIVNRSQFRKFGLKVAELVATMRPRGR